MSEAETKTEAPPPPQPPARPKPKKPPKRWLIRRGGKDFGPFTQPQMLKAIDRKEVDPSTMVCPMGEQIWQPAGVYAVFRNYFADAADRWEREEIEESVAATERSLKRAEKVSGGAWKIILIVILVVGGGGGYVFYRILKAKPSGIMDVVKVEIVSALPPALEVEVATASFKPAEGYKVKKARYRRGKSYDTAGMKLEGQGQGPVSTMDLGDSGGGGSGLTSAMLSKIEKKATPKLLRCASAAAAKSSSFKGGRVSFLIRPGRLASFTLSKGALGNKAFAACVKRALRSVKVPKFSGSERRMTIPISIR